jgi:hypothetical protein
MDIIFEELFEELHAPYDLDDEFRGGQESPLDFLDDTDEDMSLTL